MEVFYHRVATCEQPIAEDDGKMRAEATMRFSRSVWIPLVLLLAACRKDDYDGDGYLFEVDCDDTNPAVHPDADEACNGGDDDCDGATDEDPVDGPLWYPDEDSDDYGDGEGTVSCEGIAGHAEQDGDCDDDDDEINPGATEMCNGIDDDCDGTIDPDTSADAPTWYADDDGDSYGAGDPIVACKLAGGVSNDDDCDDGDADTNPDGFELCDGIDNNCSGKADNGTAVASYEDADGDGFGNPATERDLCEPHDGWVDDGTDCDDDTDAVNPDATEVCNGIDDDCDAVTDPPTSADALTWYPDGDEDGVGAGESFLACEAEDASLLDGDCKDDDPDVLPGVPDRCTDGDPAGDRNCDGKFDGCEQCHPYEPVQDLEWEKVFEVTWNGEAGEETQTGAGKQLTSNGTQAWATDTELTAGSSGWDARSYTTCGTDGALYQVESAGSYTDEDLGGPHDFAGTNTPPRQVLGKYDVQGTDATWTFEYDLAIEASTRTGNIHTVGSTNDEGLEMVTVPAGEFLAWKVTSTWTQDYSEFDGNLESRTSTFWHAEALGLVKEVTVDTGTGAVVMQKELVSYSGL